MDELELTQKDRERIKVQIKLPQIITLLFTVALILFLVLIPFGLYLFGKNLADGWIQRGGLILAIMVIPLIVMSLTNIVKIVDLRTGKKLKLETSHYDLKKTKNDTILQIRAPLKLELGLYDGLLPLLKASEPITVEIAKRSKILLSITQGGDNLLETVERESDAE
jgi:hypothetical protein